jgi:hypothetical protein
VWCVQNWKELEEQKAFRRVAGLEVTGRLYDAAFVGAAGRVAEHARARVARALAYKGAHHHKQECVSHVGL